MKRVFFAAVACMIRAVAWLPVRGLERLADLAEACERRARAH